MGTRIAQALLKPINTTGPIILGIYTMLWGFWLANPFWDVFARAPLYDIMGTLAPEWAWGLAALVVGALVVWGVIRQHPTILMLGAGAGGWLWAAIAVFYFVADFMNTGGITSLMICVYSVFIYLNIKVNVWNPMRTHHSNSQETEEL